MTRVRSLFLIPALSVPVAIATAGMTALLVASAAWAAAAGWRPALAAAPAGSDVEKTQVCFVVHNPGGPIMPGTAPQLTLPPDPTPHAIIADRYASQATDPNKVIVLLYGLGGNRDLWDFRPDFSIARNLARAGYLVFAPDLLGHGYSTYPYPQRATLTNEGHREMLHEEVEQIRGASVVAPGQTNPCAGKRQADAGRAPQVILLAHSGGTGPTLGYPARYPPPDRGHVDALIEVAAAGSARCGATSPGTASVCVGTRFAAVVAERLVSEAGREWTPFLTDGSVYPYHSWQYPTYAIDPATCLDNKHFMFWDGATDADAYLDEACKPINFETIPYAEVISNTVDDVAHTPAGLPVLFVFMDHDNIVPSGANSPDNVWCNSVLPPGHEGCQQPNVTYWKQTCPCAAHVSSFVMRNSGHQIVWDKTMPAFTQEVATWLAANGLGPDPAASAASHSLLGASAAPAASVTPLPNTASGGEFPAQAWWTASALLVLLLLGSMGRRRSSRARPIEHRPCRVGDSSG
jgi:pimeloyl-ACP methyl ester carboxylesterase